MRDKSERDAAEHRRCHNIVKRWMRPRQGDSDDRESGKDG